MEVLGYDRYITDEKKKSIEEIGIMLVDNLDVLLRKSDFVSLHVPLTKETKNIIGAGELKMMKPTAYLISTARGGVIDRRALVEALKSKKLQEPV